MEEILKLEAILRLEAIQLLDVILGLEAIQLLDVILGLDSVAGCDTRTGSVVVNQLFFFCSANQIGCNFLKLETL